MTTQADKFFADVAPDAQIASARTGVPVSTILAQWANETGYGTSSAFVHGNNYAGVSPGGHIATYADRAAGLAAYIKTLLQSNYSTVRAVKDPEAAAVAFGESPWAAGRYLGTGAYATPGGALLQILRGNNLVARYDASNPGAATGGNPVASSTSTGVAPVASSGVTVGGGGGFSPVDALKSGAGALVDAGSAVGSVIDPTKLPGTVVNGIKGLLDGAKGDLTRLVFTGLFLAGGVAMVVGGAYLAAKPQLQPVVNQAKQAGQAAALAAA